jgi:hypothetical protein
MLPAVALALRQRVKMSKFMFIRAWRLSFPEGWPTAAGLCINPARSASIP